MGITSTDEELEFRSPIRGVSWNNNVKLGKIYLECKDYKEFTEIAAKLEKELTKEIS